MDFESQWRCTHQENRDNVLVLHLIFRLISVLRNSTGVMLHFPSTSQLIVNSDV